MSGGRDDASWLSTIFLLWVNPLVRLAYDGPIEMRNLPPLPKGSDSESLLKRFDEAWGEQMKLPRGKRRWELHASWKTRERREGRGYVSFVSFVSFVSSHSGCWTEIWPFW